MYPSGISLLLFEICVICRHGLQCLCSFLVRVFSAAGSITQFSAGDKYIIGVHALLRNTACIV